MRQSGLILSACLLLVLAGCSRTNTDWAAISYCTGQIIRLSDKTIDNLNDEEVKQVLNNNRQLEAAGCK